MRLMMESLHSRVAAVAVALMASGCAGDSKLNGAFGFNVDTAIVGRCPQEAYSPAFVYLDDSRRPRCPDSTSKRPDEPLGCSFWQNVQQAFGGFCDDGIAPPFILGSRRSLHIKLEGETLESASGDGVFHMDCVRGTPSNDTTRFLGGRVQILDLGLEGEVDVFLEVEGVSGRVPALVCEPS